MLIPSVMSKDKVVDLPTSFFTDRVIFVTGEIDDEAAAVIICELLQLEAQDPATDITMYINSPGGSVSSGLAIYDTMQYVSCDISTVCVGMAASMGAFLLAAGTKGKRFALPHSQVMIHQPLGGVRGQATEIEIVARHILDVRETVSSILAEHTGKPIEVIQADTDRDNYLFAEQAVEYGIVDAVKRHR